MNLNFTPEKPNLFIRDSIKSNKQFNLTDNKSKSYKKEDDPFFSVNSSKTSQEIKNKYNEISEIKSKTTNNNEKFNELLINKKYSMSSLKSINETSQKRNLPESKYKKYILPILNKLIKRKNKIIDAEVNISEQTQDIWRLKEGNK